MTFWYRVCYWIVRIGLFFWHPVFRTAGRELIPAGRVILCANHSGMADPLWVMLALNAGHMIRIIAKQELRRVPVIGWIMEKFGIIFVRRGQHDTAAFDSCVQALMQDETLLVFPEGTRCNGSKHVRPKTGAVRMAVQSGSPIVPIFVTRNRTPFCPVEVIFGEPIRVEVSLENSEAVHAASDEVLRTIYTLGGDEYANHIGEDSGVLLRS